MADLIDQADVEARIGPRCLVDLLDDDGDGIADASRIAALLTAASKIARGILYRAFPSSDQIDDLVEADEGVKNDVVEIFVGLASGGRPHMLGPDGKSPFSSWRAEASKRLNAIADAQIRSIGEETAGANQTLTTTVQPTRTPIFAATADDPIGPGGF